MARVANPMPTRTRAVDVDEFVENHPRAKGHIVRTGRGRGPADMASSWPGLARSTQMHLGFPMAGDWAMAHDCHGVILGWGAEMTWNGELLHAGQALLVPPGSELHAVLPEGSILGTISLPTGEVQSAAEVFELDISISSPTIVEGSEATALIDAHRAHLGLTSGCRPPDDGIARTLARACAPGDSSRRANRRLTTSSQVVALVRDHLDETGRWSTSTLDMCRAAHVSERRLQMAFRDLYGMSPKEYLRFRALSAVNRQLRDRGCDETLVSSIALDHGFGHLGRFAREYRATFGELPSVTLSRAA